MSHDVSKATSEIHKVLSVGETPLTDESSMPNKPHKQGPQMPLWKSDDGIVPLKLEDQSSGSKLGNASAGKAVRPIRDSARASTVLSDGDSVLTRLARTTNDLRRTTRQRTRGVKFTHSSVRLPTL